MGDDNERLARIETIFGKAMKEARGPEVKIDEGVTVDAHVDHVRILVGGHLNVLFKINANGLIRGPILGFHDTTELGSINDDAVELNIAWTIRNELSDQMRPRAGTQFGNPASLSR
jgi:hypothetical protein